MFCSLFLGLFIKNYFLYHFFLHLTLYFALVKYNFIIEIVFNFFHFRFYFIFFVFPIIQLLFSSIYRLYPHLSLNFLSNLLSINFLFKLLLSLESDFFNIGKFLISILFKHFLFNIISHAIFNLNPSFDSLSLQFFLLFLNRSLH